MIIAQRSGRMMGVRVVDIYFPDAIEKVQFVADIGVILQAATPIPGALPFYTLKIDLRNDTAQILSALNKNHRYEIRRAENRDQLTIEMVTVPTQDDIRRYADFFDKYFAASADLAPCNRNRLRALGEQDALALTQARHENGSILAAHATIVDRPDGRIRLLYAASYPGQRESSMVRQLIGRANRLLHWKEMLRFKDLGFNVYDFGGIGGPNASEKQRRIAQFKRSFGGQECVEYNAIIGKTALGKMALAAQKLTRKRYRKEFRHGGQSDISTG